MTQKYAWQGKICNPAQIGGIETSVIDNGPGKGVRIAWINTGCGLRYKVVLDKAMDIVDAVYNQYNLAWHSHVGITNPRPDANRGIEWLYSFAGGLLTTCGLTHMGPPENDEFGERGIHGRISNYPANIESIIQPDPINGKMEMSITGIIKESRMFGPNLELRRTISSTIGQPSIRIHDVVTNLGNTATPHMILYHCNFGWPLIDAGTDIIWKGNARSRGLPMDDELFNEKHNYKKCIAPSDNHKGGKEAVGFIDAASDSKGNCRVGFYNKAINTAVAIKYNKKQLPELINWQHWGTDEYVCALEPGNSLPVGQGVLRKQKTLPILNAGQSKTYDLEIAVLNNKSDIDDFVKKFN